MKVLVHLDPELCKGCGLCIFYCPRGVLRLSANVDRRGYRIAEVVNQEDCTGCDLCVIGCPDLALFVEREPE